MSQAALDRYWVGYHQDSSEITVFDPELRVNGTLVELVRVTPFDEPARPAGVIFPHDIRLAGRQVTDPALRVQAVASFREWAAGEEERKQTALLLQHERARAAAEQRERELVARERRDSLEDLVRRATQPANCGRSIVDPPALSDHDIETALCWYRGVDRPIVWSTWRRGRRRALAEHFGRRTDSARELARLLSARLAERAVEHWLSGLGFIVEDVAGQQRPDDIDGDWCRCDLRVLPRPGRGSGERELPRSGGAWLDTGDYFEVDVKNARRPRGHGRTYTRQTIGRFKQAHLGEDVCIVGVLSPFQWADVMLGHPPHEGEWNDAPLVVLGWTTLRRLNALRAAFDDPNLVHLNPVAPKDRTSLLLPPWAYESPALLYGDCVGATGRLQRELELDPSALDVLRYSTEQRVALATALGVAPAVCGARLPELSWQAPLLAELAQAFERHGRVLPVLQLVVLKHFVEQVVRTSWGDQHTESDYHPRGYRSLLWVHPEATSTPDEAFWADVADRRWNSQAGPELERAGGGQFPAGVWDPLRVIATLVDALEDLWDADRRHLLKYRGFSLSAKNILWAVHGPTGTRRTILSYCGGDDSNGPCGRFPLLLGSHPHCARGKLTCECRYCCDKCQSRSTIADERQPN